MSQGSSQFVVLWLESGNKQPLLEGIFGETGPGDLGYFDLRCPDWVHGGDESVANEVYLRNALSYTDHHLSRLPVVLVAREGAPWGTGTRSSR